MHFNKMILTSKKLFKRFIKRSKLVLSVGGTVTFEWPKHNSGWNNPILGDFLNSTQNFSRLNLI